MNSAGDTHLTIGQLAGIFDEPEWRVRRIVDQLDADIPRAGLYRLVPRELLGDIAVALKQAPRRRRERERTTA